MEAFGLACLLAFLVQGFGNTWTLILVVVVLLSCLVTAASINVSTGSMDWIVIVADVVDVVQVVVVELAVCALVGAGALGLSSNVASW